MKQETAFSSQNTGYQPGLIRKSFGSGVLVVLSSLLIALSGCSSSSQNNTEPRAGSGGDTLRSGASTSDVKAFLTRSFTQVYDSKANTMPKVGGVVLESGAPAQDSNKSGGSSDDAFSGTNNQVAGVDEGDIWKYDGEVFYVLSPAKVTYSYKDCDYGIPLAKDSAVNGSAVNAIAVDAIGVGEHAIRPICHPNRNIEKPASVRIVRNDKTQLANYVLKDVAPTDLYLANNAIAVIGNEQRLNSIWHNYRAWQQGKINIKVVDVQNPDTPQDRHSITIDGYMVKSRRIGDELYIVSRFSPNIHLKGLEYNPQNDDAVSKNKAILAAQEDQKILPEITINGDTRSLVTGGDCWIMDTPKSIYNAPILTSISRINLTTGEVKNRCLGGQAQGIYMSQNNLYLYDTVYWYAKIEAQQGEAENQVLVSDAVIDWDRPRTLIHQFDLEGFSYTGSGSVSGLLGWNHQSFRFGELNDEALGVVTTTRDWRAGKITHELHVIKAEDGKLKPLAKLPNEASPAPIGKPGEDIYSVRFMQDRAYIVTFQRTDPLYVIDLSDPAQPKVTGELEIPGFSEYLHPVGRDLLIGVGKEAVEGSNGAVYNLGVKVSLFDVSDISKPLEKAAIAIGKRGTRTPLSYDHLAFTGMAQGDLENGGSYRFGFPIMEHGGKPSYVNEKEPNANRYNWLQSGLYLFEISSGELKQSGAIITDKASAQQKYESNYRSRRGLIQGDKVYHLRGSDLFSADWGDKDQPTAF